MGGGGGGDTRHRRSVDLEEGFYNFSDISPQISIKKKRLIFQSKFPQNKASDQASWRTIQQS